MTALSVSLFEADTDSLPVRFTYTKDSGDVSTRAGVPNGVFGAENKTSVLAYCLVVGRAGLEPATQGL